MAELFYIIVLGLSVLFACMSQEIVLNTSKGVVVKRPFNKKFLILSFIPLWFFICFSKPGLDYDNYSKIIDAVSWNHPDYFASEIGFNYLCIIIKTIFSQDANIVIFILRTITLIMVYGSLYVLREKINLGVSVFIYGTVIYLFSFYGLSQVLAASFELLAFSILYTEGKRSWVYIIAIIGAQLHSSAYIAVLLYVIIDISLRKPESFYNIRWVYLGGLIVLVGALSTIIHFLENSFESLHYSIYLDDTEGGLGLKVFVEYAFLFAMYLGLPKQIVNLRIRNSLFIFFVTSFFVAILAYSISVGNRVQTVLMAQNVVLFSQLYKLRSENKKRMNSTIILGWIYLTIEIVLSIYQNFYGLNELTKNQLFNPFTGKLM